MRLRVLTWNLMHGRSQPPAGRDLQPEFTAALAGWEWDVALLQEVPPWWPHQLAVSLRAEQRCVLTSRNGLLALRRAVAVRWPDVIKSNGGGANAILARNDRIVADRALLLRRVPERRWVHATKLACGVWVANIHASAAEARATVDCRMAAQACLEWAGGDPVALGGDLNVRKPRLDGLTQIAARDVDHVFVTPELALVTDPQVLERGELSDHPPLAATVERSGRQG